LRFILHRVSLHGRILPADAQGLFAPGAGARFAALYPDRPGTFRHALAGHPLFTPEALADAAMRMNPADVECRHAPEGHGGGFIARAVSTSPAELVRGIATAESWAMLRFIEQLPEYAALLADLLGEAEPAIRAATGASLALRGFIFVSSPGMLTPFHFDPEHNVLLQLEGEKTFHAYPAGDPFLSACNHHRLHERGDNMLDWREDFGTLGESFALGPGDGLHVPYKAPHWVRVGALPSISLSMTWKSAARIDEDDAWRLHARVARWGLEPAPPPAQPARNRARALTFRAMRRLRLA
jgi:hypothetical protein